MKKKFQWWQVDAPLTFPNDADHRWCEKVMGEPAVTARWWYEHSSDKFYFRNETDAMWFELRWIGQNESSNT